MGDYYLNIKKRARHMDLSAQEASPSHPKEEEKEEQQSDLKIA